MKRLRNFLMPALLALSITASAQDVIPKVKISELEQTIRGADRPLVVNFWATFCAPCIKEIPYFQELVKKYDAQGVRLLLVSLDLPEDYKKIAAFAAKRGFTAPIRFLDESNADLFCPKIDPKWSGSIPATLFINKTTGYRSFFEDGLSRDQFEKELGKMVAPAGAK